MQKILVTGASGFIGRHLVSRLINTGHKPRVLVRDPRKLERLSLVGLDVVPGALPDRAVTAKAVRGVDTVLHLAALATAHSRDPEQYMRINAQAVDVLLDESAAAGVGRIVHVSTIAALPPVRPAAICSGDPHPTLYAASKTAAEALVRRHAATRGEAVIVRPTRVYGPGPWNDANGTTRLMAMYLRGRLRFRPDDGGVQANKIKFDNPENVQTSLVMLKPDNFERRSRRPGNIIDVKVAVGDTVAEGDVLMILEAMKMENEILAPVAGKIAGVQVAAGAAVNSNDVLIVIA